MRAGLSPREGHHGQATAQVEPPPTPVGTLAGAAQLGDFSGSGNVPEASQLQPYGGPGLVPGLPFPITTDAAPIMDLPPDSFYQDRQLHGGVQTLSAFGEFLPVPPFAGGFQVLTGRPALAPMYGGAMQPQATVADASWREAPGVLDLCRSTPGSLGDEPGLQQ